MDIVTYFHAVRNQWRLVALVTSVALIAALAIGLNAPPRYTATARLLVLIEDPTRVDIEDALAYDVPAIVRGRPFAVDVATALANRGLLLQPEAVTQALSATNLKREVTLSASSADPAAALAIAQTAVTQLQQAGLRYWGNGAPIPQRPGLTVVVLDAPQAALRTNGTGELARAVALRTLAGFGAGLALVALEAYGAGAWRALRSPPSE
jgi:hypothetical protein